MAQSIGVALLQEGGHGSCPGESGRGVFPLKRDGLYRVLHFVRCAPDLYTTHLTHHLNGPYLHAQRAEGLKLHKQH